MNQKELDELYKKTGVRLNEKLFLTDDLTELVKEKLRKNEK